MKIDSRFIQIDTQEADIVNLLYDLMINPRKKSVEWSLKTHQTPNMKVGYPGQHLVSLVTGVPGERSGARGNDLIDGSEIKSCSRIDQMDKCKTCKQPVLRIEQKCSFCHGSNISRMRDSKWLFTIRSLEDLEVFNTGVKRVILVLGDYPNFDQKDFDTIRIEIFEIWNQTDRGKIFNEILRNYYYNIYLIHKQNSPNKVPAPKNFWPDSYQFYLCNPIKIFSSTIKDSINSPEISIDTWIRPYEDRMLVPSLNMPINKLNCDEKKLLEDIPLEVLKSNLIRESALQYSDYPLQIIDSITSINEETKKFLPLREDTTFTIPSYQRRSH